MSNENQIQNFKYNGSVHGQGLEDLLSAENFWDLPIQEPYESFHVLWFEIRQEKDYLLFLVDCIR